MKKYSWLFFILLFGNSKFIRSQAIINTATISHDLDSAISLVVDLSGNFSRGNLSVDDLGGSLGFGISLNEDQSIWVLAGGNVLNTQDEQVQRGAFSHIRHNWELNPRLTLQTFGQIQSNTALDINNRTLLGSTLGLDLDQSGNSFIGLGSFWEAEFYGISPNANGLRANAMFASEWSGDVVEWTVLVYYQPYWMNLNDYRAIINSDFRVEVSESIEIGTSLSSRFDSRPHSNLFPWDFSLLTTLRYSFNKS